MSTPHDEMLDNLAGIEDDEALTPEDLEAMAKDDAEIDGEAPASANAELADEEEGAAKEPQEPQAPKLVPVAELVAERKQRQELQRRVQELEAARQQPQQPPPPEAPKVEPPADPEPDYLDDPKAWTEWKIRQNERELEALREQVKSTTQAQQFNQAETALVSTLQRSEATFLQEHPDYYQALNHARERVFHDTKAELELLGVQATDEQIVQHLMNQERQLAASLVQRGVNPAQYAYAIAQRRYGYQPAGQAPPQAPQARPDGEAARQALRGLPTGDTGLQPETGSGNLPPEFAAAFSERFGRR